ncbi:MAG: hypothetical protein AB7F59_07925 [Bdellovibrionales bacterium]
MIRGNLPPQAYTKDVLAQAFAWLQNQDDKVKHMAQNSDALVALYLRAKRHGDAPPHKEDQPASVESFRHQLKSLAQDLQQFVPEEEQRPRIPASMPAIEDFKEPTPPPAYARPPQTPPPPQIPQAPVIAPQNTIGALALDSQSLEILKKVRNHLNLSSEMEALRMLLVLGHERLQTLFRS